VTTRWLRGRILDHLRDAPGGDWVAFDSPLGEHSTDAVRGQIERLGREGVIEVDPFDNARARLALE
jgi:hypothetical protein